MRTLVVSDLHLGTRLERDVLRRAEVDGFGLIRPCYRPSYHSPVFDAPNGSSRA